MAGRPTKNSNTTTAEKSKIKAVKKPEAPQPKIKAPETVKSDPQADYIKSLQGDEPVKEKTLQEEAAELMANMIDKVSKPISKEVVERIKAAKFIIEPDMPAILAKYEEKVNTPSDINELLPFLRAVSDSCEHITEFGVRNPTSTYAFLAGNPKSLVSYDIGRYPEVDEVEAIAPNFKFVLGSTLDVEIDETDFLFVDTYHSSEQLKRELERHAHKAKKYIGFHDVTSFWENSEPPYEGINSELAVTAGLRYAIEPFLAQGNFVVDFRTDINNGLMILRRIR